MAILRQARGIGAVGSILILAGVVANAAAGLLSSVAGLILVLIAVKFIGEIVKDRELYGNMTMAVALALIGAVIGFLFVFGGFLSFVGSSSTTTSSSDLFALFSNLIGSILPGLVVAWIFFLLSSVLVRRCYDSIATHLGEDLFNTTGKLFLMGRSSDHSRRRRTHHPVRRFGFAGGRILVAAG